MRSKSDYVADFATAWEVALREVGKRGGVSEMAIERLRRLGVVDVRETIDALSDSSRPWKDDQKVWKAWATWYSAWVRDEIERALPDIVAHCVLDNEARRQETWRKSKAMAGRINLARRIVDHLAGRASSTLAEIERAIYPSAKAAKARRALRKLVAELEGLGALGQQKGRDGVARYALFRDLWPEDCAALVD